MMKSVSFRSLLSITFCVLLLFLLPASLAFAEGNSESATFTFQIDDHGRNRAAGVRDLYRPE